MKQIQDLLSRQMTRKEFLQVLGMAILTLIGVGNFIALWRKQSEASGQSARDQAASGFGSRRFGA